VISAARDDRGGTQRSMQRLIQFAIQVEAIPARFIRSMARTSPRRKDGQASYDLSSPENPLAEPTQRPITQGHDRRTTPATDRSNRHLASSGPASFAGMAAPQAHRADSETRTSPAVQVQDEAVRGTVGSISESRRTCSR